MTKILSKPNETLATYKQGRIETSEKIDLPEETSLLLDVISSDLLTETGIEEVGSDWNKRALASQTAVNHQIQKDIAKLKEMGEPIYYSRNGKLIRENADGHKFEYRLLADGSEELLSEIID
jgi:hypothetical protein